VSAQLKHSVVLLLLVFASYLQAQQDSVRAVIKQDSLGKCQKKPMYYKQEEIIFEGKRYRVNNNYVSLGPLIATSSLRSQAQKGIAIDFNWHIRRQYFQTGVLMSGNNFGDNNHLQGHLTYGLRREGSFHNAAVFGGVCYSYGVTGDITTGPIYYNTLGGYLAAQYVIKFAYDLGLGLEAFSEISPKQRIFGVKVIAFFSGAYRGLKRNYNPNVRAENPKWQK
jgi:hypothetical protein